MEESIISISVRPGLPAIDTTYPCPLHREPSGGNHSTPYGKRTVKLANSYMDFLYIAPAFTIRNGYSDRFNIVFAPAFACLIGVEAFHNRGTVGIDRPQFPPSSSLTSHQPEPGQVSTIFPGQ